MPWSRFRRKKDMPEGLWSKCKKCGETLFNKDLEANLNVCSACGYSFHLSAQRRMLALLDAGSFHELWADLHPMDRLGFVDKDPYPVKLQKSAAKSGLPEAAIAGTGSIDGKPVAICALDFFFMGGSMGTVVGEKVTRTIELATQERLPAIVISCSGGARMHEGALSLMQMAKTSAALARHHDSRGLYISVLANPTTGGVMASFAALGDLIYAEPGALIGFAGPRVIQETLRTELPEGFQTSEFLLEKGFIDKIVKRHDLRNELARAIGFLWSYSPQQLEKYAPPAVSAPEASKPDAAAEGGAAPAGSPSAAGPGGGAAGDASVAARPAGEGAIPRGESSEGLRVADAIPATEAMPLADEVSEPVPMKESDRKSKRRRRGSADDAGSSENSTAGED